MMRYKTMKNIIKFCDRADFYFIVQYLAHHDIDINTCDDVDELYNDVNEAYKLFEVSPQYLQSTSYIQAINDFLSQ